MKNKRIIVKAQFISFVLIGLAIFGFVLIMAQLIFYSGKPDNFGVIGDAVGGILNPIIAIASALLTFLAFYIQKIANDELRHQFNQQQNNTREDFHFKNYKDRILLIIDEVNNFNISFHDRTLISDIGLLNNPTGKKYNFIGIQAINLFYGEFYRLMGNNFENFKPSDSFHSISLHLNNLIAAFYNIHQEVEQCNLPDNYCQELKELLEYTFYSKFNYFLSYLVDKHTPFKIKDHITYLLDYYNKRSRGEI